MGLFLSTVTNKIDAKGRVSVPARFRSVLAEQGHQAVVCFPSFTVPAVEAMTLDKAEEYAARLEADFNPFDDAADAFAQSILAASFELPFDGEGRILLPQDLMEHARLDGHAAFVGLGRRFQIWEPDAHQAYSAKARGLARERRERFGPKPVSEDGA